jgi:molybdopterin-guanine dinucleotide biosynthesis protein A
LRLAREDAAGFVLAGGQSRRMGVDKALAKLDGEPLIVRVLALLKQAGVDGAIAGARPDLSIYAPAIEDAGRGPLGGVCAALESTQRELAVFVSVDMPLLPASLVTALLAQARRTCAGVTLVAVQGFVQTFPAVVHQDMLAALASEMQAGNNGCFSAFRAAAVQTGKPMRILAVENLVQTGEVEHPKSLPAAFWFLNINTPYDLARGESLVAQAIA